MLLHATVALLGWDSVRTADDGGRFTDLGQPPDFQQGFGRLDLSRRHLTGRANTCGRTTCALVHRRWKYTVARLGNH